MDVAQIVLSAVMPGAAALPNSSEPSTGGLAPSPLFREMFAKAASAAEISGVAPGAAGSDQLAANSQSPSPGRLLMGGKGATLFSPGLVMSGGGTIPEEHSPEAGSGEDANIGTLLSRAMALRQMTAENARTPGHRDMSLHKGRENSGEVKGASTEAQQEAEMPSGSEILLGTDNSSGETPETELTDSRKEIQQQETVGKPGIPSRETLPAGLVGVMLAGPVVQDVSHDFTTGVPESSTRSELLSAVQGDGVARMESRPVVAEGIADLLMKNGGSAIDSMEKRVISLLQPEITERNALPGNQEDISSAGKGMAPEAAEAGANATSGLASFPGIKKAADAALNGENPAGKDHFKPARPENASAVRQAFQDTKLEGKGETVQRELPSGVTVLNPAQTVTMGRSVGTADAPFLAVQTSDRGRFSRPDGEVPDEKGRVNSVAGEMEKVVLKKEGFSSQDNSNLNHDSGTTGGNGGFSQAAVSSGSFDSVAKGRMESLSEVPRGNEVSQLHENILSQVREKLVNQDPSGTASKITLKLNPHELGELQINVRLENHKMSVDITAQNPVVKEALLQNIDQLKDTLLRQNISMERFNVSTGDGGGQAFNQSFREGHQAAHQAPDNYSYPLPGFYRDDSQVNQVAFADSKENSLVDMRF